MPHGHCYLWQPATLWLNVGSDGLIAAAYYAIPIGLFYIVRERRTAIPYPWILMMFGAFIFLCGTTHLIEIWTVWKPDYRVQGAVKLLTGLVSIATMFALFKLIPQAGSCVLRSNFSAKSICAPPSLRTSTINYVKRSWLATRRNAN
jgi:hypothetical protein